MPNAHRPFPASLVAAGWVLAGSVMLVACSSAPQPATTEDAASVMPASPVTDKMIRCLADAGWEAQRSIYGGFDGPTSLSTAQQSSYQAAVDACADESGWSTSLSDFSDTQRSELYAQELVERQCLSDLGYPGEEPPSEQTYIDTFASVDQYYAFYANSELPQSEFERAISTCPPPTWFLNISGF